MHKNKNKIKFKLKLLNYTNLNILCYQNYIKFKKTKILTLTIHKCIQVNKPNYNVQNALFIKNLNTKF